MIYNILHDLPPEFTPLRSLLEANLSLYIKIITDEVGYFDSAEDADPLEPWQSKIGGYPSQVDDNLYFFVEDFDLINLDFSKVESYFFRQ